MSLIEFASILGVLLPGIVLIKKLSLASLIIRQERSGFRKARVKIR